MQIKHIQKTTLIDYPGYIAAIIFVGGCNMRCPYCYNRDLVYRPEQLEDIPFDDVWAFLEKRRRYLDGLVITGGEPLLQPKLVQFLAKVRPLGYKIKLDTNGTHPLILKTIMEQQLVDYVAMDIKGPLAYYAHLTGLTSKSDLHTTKSETLLLHNITESLALLKENLVEYEFRTTVWSGYFNKYPLAELLPLITGTKKYFLHNYFWPAELGEASEQPATNQEISPILKQLRNIVPQVELRGDWY